MSFGWHEVRNSVFSWPLRFASPTFVNIYIFYFELEIELFYVIGYSQFGEAWKVAYFTGFCTAGGLHFRAPLSKLVGFEGVR